MHFIHSSASGGGGGVNFILAIGNQLPPLSTYLYRITMFRQAPKQVNTPLTALCPQYSNSFNWGEERKGWRERKRFTTC